MASARTIIGHGAVFGGLALAAALAASPAAAAEPAPVLRPAPTAADWSALGKLPDWSGVWIPNVADQRPKEQGPESPPWRPEIQKQIDFLFAEEKAGRPKLILAHCLPHGMPSWMVFTHNAMEILFTPGRVTMLGESDGNRLRRIYTDGRPHPDDPDLTFHGHSIGHWEGDTLVVDTVGIVPQSYIGVSEAVGVPNNGDLHVVERIRLQDPNTLRVDLEITANKVLTKPWKTTRYFLRRRDARFDIVEGECVQGWLNPVTDKDGNQVFEFMPPAEDGAVSLGGQ